MLAVEWRMVVVVIIQKHFTESLKQDLKTLKLSGFTHVHTGDTHPVLSTIFSRVQIQTSSYLWIPPPGFLRAPKTHMPSKEWMYVPHTRAPLFRFSISVHGAAIHPIACARERRVTGESLRPSITPPCTEVHKQVFQSAWICLHVHLPPLDKISQEPHFSLIDTIIHHLGMCSITRNRKP